MSLPSSRVEAAEHVLLIHGLASTRYLMTPLAWRLNRDGFTARTWGYWSIYPGLAAQARKLQRVVRQIELDPAITSWHAVTHSMGCIMLRWVLLHEPMRKLRRWVMMGPPNHGSHVARQLAGPLGWLCPPLRDLSDHPHSLVNQMNSQGDEFQRRVDDMGVQIGVIAAEWDRVVPRASTSLGSEHDFCVARGMHTDILLRRDVHRQVHHFLQCGSFQRSAAVV